MKKWLSVLFVLTFGLLTAGEDTRKAEQHGNTCNFYNSSDTLSYLNNLSDEFIIQLKRHYNGVEDERHLDDLLQSQNYIEVLNHLWSEENQEVRIRWLEKKAEENHPILLFELAREYCLQDPSLNTYVLRVLPLIDAAKCRTALDCDCTSDKSVGAGVGFLRFVYSDLLSGITKNHFSIEDVEVFFKEHFIEFWSNKKNTLMQILVPFLDEQLIVNMPSPQWIFHHGIGAFSDNDDEDDEEVAIPPSEWDAIRKKTAEEILQWMIDEDHKIARDPKGYIENMFSDE